MVILNRSRTHFLKKVELDIWNFSLFRPFKLHNALKKFYKEKFLLQAKESNRLFDNLFVKADRKLRRIFLKKKSYFGKLLVLKRRLYFFFGFMTPHTVRNFFLNIFFQSERGDFRGNLAYIVESLLVFFLLRLHFFFTPLESINYIKKGIFSIDGIQCKNSFLNLSVGSILTVNSNYWRSFFFKRLYVYWYNEYIRIGALPESLLVLYYLRYYLFLIRKIKTNKNIISFNNNLLQKNNIYTVRLLLADSFRFRLFRDNNIFSNGIVGSSLKFNSSFNKKQFTCFSDFPNILQSLDSFNVLEYDTYFFLLNFCYAFYGLKKVLCELNSFIFRTNLFSMLFKFINLLKLLFIHNVNCFFNRCRKRFGISFFHPTLLILAERGEKDFKRGFTFFLYDNMIKMFIYIACYINITTSLKIASIDNINNPNSFFFLRFFRFIKRFIISNMKSIVFIPVYFQLFKSKVFLTFGLFYNIFKFLKKKTFLMIEFVNFFMNFWFVRQHSLSFSLWSSNMIVKLNGVYEFYRSSLKKRRNIRYLKNKLYNDYLWRENVDSKVKLFSISKIRNRKEKIIRLKLKKNRAENRSKLGLTLIQSFSTYLIKDSSKITSRSRSNYRLRKIFKRKEFNLDLVSITHKKILRKRFQWHRRDAFLVREESFVKKKGVFNFSKLEFNIYIVVLLKILIISFYVEDISSQSFKENIYAYYKKNVF